MGAGNGDAEAPPSYESLYGKLKQTKKESAGNVDFAKNSVSICYQSCAVVIVIAGIIVCCGLGFALPIAEIVVGVLDLHDCRFNENIPIYLIVSGVFSLLVGCGSGGSKAKDRYKGEENEEEGNKANKSVGFCSCLITLFLIAWLITGTVWVVDAKDKHHGIPDPSYNGTGVDPFYCKERLFLFAFWLTMAKWIVVGVCMVIACLGCCLMCCIKCCTNEE